MPKKFQYSVLVALILTCYHTISSAQTAIPKIVQLQGSTLLFSNGDSLPLVALKDTNYQLIILLFHAEEDTIGLDPGLSVNGRWRAIHLNKLFRDINFKGYFTTPFRNNILTLQPLMDYKECKASYYDQADIQALTENIKTMFPSPVIVMTHPETIKLIFEQLTQHKNFTVKGEKYSEKLIIIQRSKKRPTVWNEFKYSIR